MVERLAKATVGSDIWKEYDRGVLSEEEILNRFIANDPELEEDLRKTLANVHGIMERCLLYTSLQQMIFIHGKKRPGNPY